jgi:hypothetical protein
LLRDREFAFVIEDIVRETKGKDVSFVLAISHSKKASNLTISVQVLLLDVRYSQYLQED